MISRQLVRIPGLQLPFSSSSSSSSAQLLQYRNLSSPPPKDNNNDQPTPTPPSNPAPEPDLDPRAPTPLSDSFGANQHMPIDEALQQRLRTILWQFRAPIRYAFAYGSGVFSQGGSSSSKKKPMIDLIFGVTYSQHWHSLNLAQHPEHYSFLGRMGSRVVSHVQDDFGAGVYFNPYIEINGTILKYGITNHKTLLHDLQTWETLYLSGRLQKPVKILRDDPEIRLANHQNLLSALRTALLLLPETFSERELYTTIAGISYTGDPRMSLWSENPNKVRDIVGNQLSQFRRLYAPIVAQLPNLHIRGPWAAHAEEEVWMQQDMSPQRRANIIRRLPPSFRQKLYFQYQRKFAIPALEFEEMMVGKTPDEERLVRKEGGEFERRIAMDVQGVGQVVRGVVKATVAWPSIVQTLKGPLTAGAGRSLRYLRDKVGKWVDGSRGK
ncbi:Mmp37-domain-containing protein [Choiromyces venosus 120613-1]|uniref:Phosphatidate cytidylyltransferase, mitochondrial n=1 Tax=Choiromyces venosus 120613-1 TaxID=1336337 RepID=A0A3N4J280_9PEZI|nr:Mmp37-domain-containing protein [Choiromyces venosus 120613-1]